MLLGVAGLVRVRREGRLRSRLRTAWLVGFGRGGRHPVLTDPRHDIMVEPLRFVLPSFALGAR